MDSEEEVQAMLDQVAAEGKEKANIETTFLESGGAKVGVVVQRTEEVVEKAKEKATSREKKQMPPKMKGGKRKETKAGGKKKPSKSTAELKVMAVQDKEEDPSSSKAYESKAKTSRENQSSGRSAKTHDAKDKDATKKDTKDKDLKVKASKPKKLASNKKSAKKASPSKAASKEKSHYTKAPKTSTPTTEAAMEKVLRRYPTELGEFSDEKSLSLPHRRSQERLRFSISSNHMLGVNTLERANMSNAQEEYYAERVGSCPAGATQKPQQQQPVPEKPESFKPRASRHSVGRAVGGKFFTDFVRERRNHTTNSEQVAHNRVHEVANDLVSRPSKRATEKLAPLGRSCLGYQPCSFWTEVDADKVMQEGNGGIAAILALSFLEALATAGVLSLFYSSSKSTYLAVMATAVANIMALAVNETQVQSSVSFGGFSVASMACFCLYHAFKHPRHTAAIVPMNGLECLITVLATLGFYALFGKY